MVNLDFDIIFVNFYKKILSPENHFESSNLLARGLKCGDRKGVQKTAKIFLKNRKNAPKFR